MAQNFISKARRGNWIPYGILITAKRIDFNLWLTNLAVVMLKVFPNVLDIPLNMLIIQLQTLYSDIWCLRSSISYWQGSWRYSMHLTSLPFPFFVSFQMYCSFYKIKILLSNIKEKSVSWAGKTNVCTSIISVSSQFSAGSQDTVKLESLIGRRKNSWFF